MHYVITGDFKWKVHLDIFIKPVIYENSNQKHEIKYKVKEISWQTGLQVHSVDAFMQENFGEFMSSKEFDSGRYLRKISDGE